MNLSGMQIFKYLPAAKKTEHTNCKECGFPTCMAFALKLTSGGASISSCKWAPEELRSLIEESQRVQQHVVNFHGLTTGGETCMFRHEKKFVSPTIFAITLDGKDAEFEKKLRRISDFKITRVGEDFKLKCIYLINPSKEIAKRLTQEEFALILDKRALEYEEFAPLFLDDCKVLEVEDAPLWELLKNLTCLRKKAIIDREEPFTRPVLVKLKPSEDIFALCAKASMLVCKYANIIAFNNFDEAMFSALFTLVQNIFTDPEKPLQVEAKTYEINNPDENSFVFLTTNFALTYFAVANEIEALGKGAYLIVTPSEGMSVLTAWSAEKITAEIASRVVSEFETEKKLSHKRLIIPGLLADLKEDLEEALKDWEIIVGPIEAYQIADFIKNLEAEISARNEGV